MLNFAMLTLVSNKGKARNMLTNRLGKLAQPQRLFSSQQSAFIKGRFVPESATTAHGNCL